MTPDPTWNHTRWSDIPQSSSRETMEAPQISGPTAIVGTSQHAALDSSSRGWSHKPRVDVEEQAHKLPSLTEAYSNASAFHSRLLDRQCPSAGGNYGPQQLVDFSKDVSSWQKLRYDDTRGNERQMPAAPLTLHIPKTQDLSSTTPGYTTIPSETYLNNVHSLPSKHTTSLPSFASLQEHAGRSSDSEEVDMAQTSPRRPCYLCTKLKSLVKEVAIAVTELDENVQTSCNKSITRTPKCSEDSPVQVILWVLDRLRYANADLQASFRGAQPGYGYQQSSNSVSLTHSRNESPSDAFKRPAEQWDQEDEPFPKRPRSGPPPTETQRRMSVLAKDNRRASIDFITTDQLHQPGFSPPLTDSIPNSAYPRTGSPTPSGRPIRALPSPSSMAYPPSAAPSLALQRTHSSGSPTSLYQPTTSLLSSSTNSATSAHFADLQHQITLKSLALQTLQSEYASLLSKFQRLNVKTQTIERKSNVADQEVNELTSKNEDLTQLLQNVQDQLEESEKRREKEREESGREKEQWLQMLDQGRRLQAKYEDDKKGLAQHIAMLQGEKNGLQEIPSAEFDGLERRRSQDTTLPGIESFRPSVGSSVDTADDVAALKAKIEFLRLSLEEARRHNRDLDERAHEVLQRSVQLGGTIDRALDLETLKDGGRVGEGVHPTDPKVSGPKSISTTKVSDTDPKQLAEASSELPSIQSVANFARAVSPSPAELGIEITKSALTPEELIKALGPLPSPGSASQVRTIQNNQECENGKVEESDSFRNQQWKKSSGDQSPGSAVSLSQQREEYGIGSFQPLNHAPGPAGQNLGRWRADGGRSPHSYKDPSRPSLDDESTISAKLASNRSFEDSPAGIDLQVQTGGVSVASMSFTTSSSMPPPPRPTLQASDFDTALGMGDSKP